ncbi:MAG: class I SAM-dependent methyltransferase [Pseudomonadota bacterium]
MSGAAAIAERKVDAAIELRGLVCPICLEDTLEEVTRESEGSEAILGETELRCAACGERLPIVLGVPYLGRFMQADLLSVLEVTSYLGDFVLEPSGQVRGTKGNRPERLGSSYAKIQDMLETAEDQEGNGVDFERFGFPKKPVWFPNRYHESVQYRQVVGDLDFRGKRVLDIGAGTGFDSLRFHRAGAEVTALEYSPLQAAIGQMNFSEFRWIGSSVTHMPFTDEHFDVVIANCALHHVLHLEDGLREMLRVLKVGGHMLTIGDSFGPNHFTEDDEVAVFNNHQAVLRGVNEQVPRFERFVSPLTEKGDALDIELMTAVVHGLQKNVGELQRWRLDEALNTLGGYRGGLCMRVRKTAPTGRGRDTTDVSPPLVPVGGFVSAFGSREQALRYLARAMPDSVVDLPVIDRREPKLRLLLGWRRQEEKESFRVGVGNGYLFATPAFLDAHLPSFEVLVPNPKTPPPGGDLRFEMRFDGRVLASVDVRPGAWMTMEPESEALIDANPGETGLLSFHLRDATGEPTALPFQVRPAGDDQIGLLMRLQALFFGRRGQPGS